MFVTKRKIITSRFFPWCTMRDLQKNLNIILQPPNFWITSPFCRPPFLAKIFRHPYFHQFWKSWTLLPLWRGRGVQALVTWPLLSCIARITQLASSMEGDNPVIYLLSMTQCILSLHVSNVSSMVLHCSTCLCIHKIVLVVGSFHKFTHHQFLKIVILKIVDFWFQKLFYLWGQCFQISVIYFRSPTTFVFIF